MSIARTSGMIGLAGIGLWLSIASVRASQPDASEATPASVAAGTGNVDDNCVYKGITLAGKVKVVESFPDVRIKAVASFPDLKVKKVSSFADRCGEWQFVESFPDFTVQYVDSFPDVEIAFVESFPGLP